ncbi:MAG: hypothetical protein LBH36_02745 [Candidatus Nomurabacteria bacterium]|jgi:hypothetical protein|nr:hypothetical protein [Candidatus Nomurabacteria bacterium]
MVKVNQHHKKTRMIAIASLVVGVLSLGVAFAALGANLLVNGTASIQSASWSVHWETTSPAPACTATGEATVSTPVVSQSSSANDTITISPSFKTGGDTVSCTFTATNTGSLNAKLGVIAPTINNLSSNNITTTLTYDDNSAPAQGDILSAASSKGYKLVFTYTGQTVSSGINNLTYSIAVPYEQANQ